MPAGRWELLPPCGLRDFLYAMQGSAPTLYGHSLHQVGSLLEVLPEETTITDFFIV
jgi:hypothetical protein